MFNNLIARAIVPVVIAVTGFVVFGCILLYTFIKADMTSEAIRTLDNCADTVVKSARYAMMEDDRDSLQNMVTNIGTRSGIELIKIYDNKGHVRYMGREEPRVLTGRIENHIKNIFSVDADADVREMVQHDVDHANGFIALSMPIPNEPQCLTAGCHVHAEDGKILGFLSIGISSDPLEKTLALLRTRMIVFCLMVLFLTMGGVAALLRRNLFMPISRLTHTAQLAVRGVGVEDLPKVDKKLGSLEADFRLLVKQRDEALLAARQSQPEARDEAGIDSEPRIIDAGNRSAAAEGSGQDPQV